MEHLDTPERIAAYIDAMLEDGDPALGSAAIGDVARSRGISQFAAGTGGSRERPSRALSEKGNLQFDRLMSVLKAIGPRLSVQPIAQAKPVERRKPTPSFVRPPLPR